MPRRQEGFSLIEIMVGVVIGMLAMVAIANIFAASEGHKRTTTGGADAQTNGAIALYMMEREIRMAGWGLDTTPFLLNDPAGTVVSGEPNIPCTTIYSYQKQGASGTPNSVPGFSFVPIAISDGAGNSPDTVTVTFFGGAGEETYAPPAQASLREAMATAGVADPGAPLGVSSVYGCAVDDMMVIKQPVNDSGKSGSHCTLMQVSSVDAATLRLSHVGDYKTSGSDVSYNPDAAYMASNGWPTYSYSPQYGAAMVQCLGKPPAAGGNPFSTRIYSVLDSELQLSIDGGAAQTVGSEVVDVQAQYGVAPAGIDQVVNSWVDAGVGPDGTDWAAPPVADQPRIKAVRIAVVTRSQQREKTQVSPATITLWNSTDNAGTWTKTKALTDDDRFYRYKVHHTVVPLRNQAWSRL